MGGGNLSRVLKQRAGEPKVTMSVSSATTIHHNIEKVCSWGIEVVGDEEAEDLRRDKRYIILTVGVLEPERLKYIIEGLGVPWAFDVVGICAQDHGTPPEGISHLDYRHQIFKAIRPEAVEIILATGPKRRMVRNFSLPIEFGAPMGDNLMTGTVGVFEAIRRRKGLHEISYL